MKDALKPLSCIFFALLLASNALCQTFDIYVSDAGDFTDPALCKIYKYDENGENPEVFIDEELDWPQDILFLEDQDIVLVSNLNTNKICKYDAEQGTYLGDFATGISGPTRIKIGADNLLYVLQWSGNGLVKRYQLDGTFVDDFTNMGVSQSIGIDWDSDGNLYVSSYAGSLVRKFDPNGDDLGVFINASLQGPTNIWFDETGDLFACNWDGTTISRFDPDGNFIEAFITGMSNPEGVAIYPDGKMLIGNRGTGAVKLYEADGSYIEDFIVGGAGGLLFPNAVVLREQSSVSVAQVERGADLVFPTIGTEFYISQLNAQNLEMVSIYNSSGVLIEKKQGANTRLWNAAGYPDGVYILVVKLVSGDPFFQKVIVKK